MKKCIITILLIIGSYHHSQIFADIEKLDDKIVRELILIRNTYNWVDNDKVKFDMIRKQNMLVSDEQKYLYREFIIEVK